MQRLQRPGHDEPTLARGPELALDTLVHDRLIAVALPPSAGYPASLKRAGARDVLVLARKGPQDARRDGDHALLRYESTKSVFANNCQVAILHGTATPALMNSKTLAGFATILVPYGPSLALALPALLRHVRRKRLAVAGWTRIEASGRTRRYLVLDSRVPATDNRRQFGTAGLSALDVLLRLGGLDYVVLRWPELIEQGRHEGDIDILVSHQDADKLVARFSDSVATYPLDIYSDDGSGGYYFNRAPYYTPGMARRMLETASITPAGIRVADARWRYLSFGYHLLLHIKSRRVPPGTNAIGPATFRAPKYFAELRRLAAAAGEPAPASFDDIEAALRRADAWPAIDLMGFYAEKSPFLKHRYFEHAALPPGLMTVFVRDFGLGAEPVARIRDLIASRFEIVTEGPVSDQIRDAVYKGVRGGNWSDPNAAGGQARPVHWFVCWDKTPAAPKRRTRKKQPRVDNEHVNLKYDIRELVGVKTRKQQRLIHTSDNSTEALEHIELLGCRGALEAHPAWRALKGA
jgi:hypothetical protein